MLVIRRLVDRRRAYTALMLPGEPPKIFPTSDAEHARILQIYKQDRAYPGIVNDFTDFDSPTPSPTPEPTRKSGSSSRRRTGSSQSG
jgi:hypothetical protein